MRGRANRTEPAAPAVTEKPAPERLLSVDAFRGFDMFWLVGGYEIVKALVVWIGWAPLTEAAEREMDHPVWSGFHWWDVIMPTFIFISGVTIPLSVTRRLERGEARSRIYWRLLQRLLILQLLDLAYYGALQHLDWHQMRFGGVLARSDGRISLPRSSSCTPTRGNNSFGRLASCWAIGGR